MKPLLFRVTFLVQKIKITRKIAALFLLQLFFISIAKGKSIAHESYAQKPLLFIENKGQVADMDGKLRPDILFTTYSQGTKLFFNGDGIYYQFSKSKTNYQLADGRIDLEKEETDLYCMDMKLVNANPHAPILRQEQSEYYENYFLGHCKEGVTNVHGYSKLVYQNIYPNIDWVIYTKEHNIKYDFIVHPGGNPKDIKIQYNHADKIKINSDGSVSVKTQLGELAEGTPVCWLGNHEKNVDAKFKLIQNVLEFDLPTYNKNQTLTIDPTLIWSRYFGGSDDDEIRHISAYGSQIHMVGSTKSTSGIAIPGFLVQTTHGGNYDTFYLNTDTSGAALYCTYFGSTGSDYAYGSSIINYNGNTCLVMVGSTTSSTNLVSNCGFDNTYGGGPEEGFVAVFYAGGFPFCTSYIGGTGTDYLTDVVSENPATSARFFIAGYTKSTTGLGTSNAFGGGAWDCFFARINLAASLTLEAARYVGGTGDETGASLQRDASGNIFLAGQTTSTNLQTAGAFQTINNGNSDAFLGKFNSAFTTQWLTYYGGSLAESFVHMTLDAAGNPYLVSNTKSAGMATAGAYQTTVKGDYDALLTKFNTSGQRQWSTYFGDTLFEYIYAIDASPANNIFLAGQSQSQYLNHNGIPPNSGNSGGSDGLLVSFNSAGQLNWSSYFGGSLDDACQAIEVSSGKIIFAGQAKSTFGIDYLSGTTYTGLYDAFIGKIVDVAVKTGTVSNSYLCPGDSVMIPFTAVGDFPIGTIFTAQLGENNSFASPIILGTTTTSKVLIRGYVPLNTPLSFSGNAIRVVCSIGGSFNLNYNSTAIGTVGSLPPAHIAASGSTAICNGSSVVLNSPISGNIISRQWFLNGSIIAGANAINYTASAAGNYKVKTLSITGCDSTSNIISVTIKAIPNASISASGTLTPCAGSSVNLNANTGAGLSYQWQKDGIDIPAATTAAYAASISGSYQVTVTNANSCSTQSAASIVTVLPVPTATLNIPSSTSICQGSDITLIANFGAGIFYQWKLNGNNIIGANTYAYSATSAGDYTVVESYGNPCNSTSNGISITVNPNPLAQITPSGTQSICNGDAITFTASSGSNYTYQWYKNLNSIAGQTTATLSTTTAGFYKVKITNSATGCSDENLPVLVTVLSKPPSVINSTLGTGTVKICSGSSLLLTANNSAGVSYQWKKDGIDIPGATNQTYGATVTGNYKVKEINGNNCDSTSNIIHVDVFTFPFAIIAPIASPYTCTGSSVTLMTHGTNGFIYKWLYNGSVITSATDTFYTTNQGGDYQVIITNSGICSDTSAVTTINPAAPIIPICLSTVDSLSQFNNIIWEKPVTTTIDSFRIYREDVTNVYTFIGAVGYNQLSLYVDVDLVNANPNAVTKRYRIATVDICGNVSQLSNYHNTIYMSGNNVGTFSWNLYDIDNEPNPVSSYVLYRDDLSSGVWHPIQSTAGTQTQITDPDYFNYSSSRYRLETNWGISCTPTSRALAGFNTSKSNVKNKSVGIEPRKAMETNFQLIPNPASHSTLLVYPIDLNPISVRILDNLGRVVKIISIQEPKSGSVKIDTDNLTDGLYTVSIHGANFDLNKKLIKN